MARRICMLHCTSRCSTYGDQGCHLIPTLPLTYRPASVGDGVDDVERLQVAQVPHNKVPVQVRHIVVRCGCAHARAQFCRIEPARTRLRHERLLSRVHALFQHHGERAEQSLCCAANMGAFTPRGCCRRWLPVNDGVQFCDNGWGRRGGRTWCQRLQWAPPIGR